MNNDQLFVNRDQLSIRFPILERTVEFAVNVIHIVNKLPKTPAGYAISLQIVRSGTSIGANLQEAQSAHSKKDFIHCIKISLKEARETKYWLIIISKSGLLNGELVNKLFLEVDEIIRILYTIIKNSKVTS